MMVKRHISVVILVVAVIAIALYLHHHKDLIAKFTNISLSAALQLIGLRLLFWAVNGLILREFAAKLRLQLKFREWFGLPAVTTMGNFISPLSGGLVARAGYLKLRHAFPYVQFASLLAANYLVTFWIIGVVGFGVSVAFIASPPHLPWQLAVCFLATVVGISAVAVAPVGRVGGRNRLARTLDNAIAGWIEIKKDHSMVCRFVLFNALNILVNAVSFWIAYKAVGLQVSFLSALLISLLAFFSLLVNLTPGNLGVQEAIVSVSSQIIGPGAGEGLVVALLIRVATLVPAFALGPIFTFLLARELRIHRCSRKTNGVETQ
jgi:uncharacterized membrane protein YbhN (UPF0104 family)